MENSWMYPKKSRYETAWPICASICLHAVLVLILNTTSPLNLIVGTESRFDIFWISPSAGVPSPSMTSTDVNVAPKGGADAPKMAVADDAAEPSKVAAALKVPVEPSEATTDGLAVTLPSASMASLRTAPAKSTLPQPAVPQAMQPPPVALHKKKERKKEIAAKIEADDETMAVDVIKAVPEAAEPPAEMVHPQPAQPARQEATGLEPARQEKPIESISTTRPVAPASKPPLVKVAQLPKDLPVSPPPVLAPAAAPAVVTKVAPPAIPQKRKQHPAQPAKAAIAAKAATPALPAVATPRTVLPATAPSHAVLPAPATPPATLSTVQTARQSKAIPSRGSAQGKENPYRPGKMAAAAGASKPPTVPAKAAPTANDRAALPAKKAAKLAEKVQEPKGLVISSLRGDLKMVISGDSGIRLFVTFRPYPKSNRERMSRSEAREQQKVLPLVARIKPETKEAVIETAREGVYTFAAESERSDGAKAAFTLKIFESGNREKVANIGTRTVSGRKVLAKVLMPEGILWDDETAFSGSLEDSDSTTKFDAQTGVYWKEYND